LSHRKSTQKDFRGAGNLSGPSGPEPTTTFAFILGRSRSQHADIERIAKCSSLKRPPGVSVKAAFS